MRMRNAEEHKKLLAQIAELEKNSVNYFDVEKEFFLIDSDNLAEIKTRLYGYSIQATGIYEQDNLTKDAVKNLDGRGCYVYVEVKDGQITIKQDLNGCWGIYLFRHGDYFALSNSFFRLLDHVKFRYPLTVNRDYCHQLILNDLCSHTYSETAVNEVSLVERNAILHIDIAAKNLETELIDYRENTVPLDSEEGIAILDSWVEFWGSVLRGVAQNTKFLAADLTGGFDSRIAFIVALSSGIDLSKMQIFSIKGTLHTYKDDYEIASQIAERYNFKLNQPLPANRLLQLSFSDAWNSYFYNLQTFHKSFMFSTQKPVNKCYQLTGYGGETIRTYWQKPSRKFMENQNWKVRPYSGFLSRELFQSLETITNSAFLAIREKYKIKDENCEDIPQYLYQETRCRHHFGKFTLFNYFRSKILISPILDPTLRTLKLNTPECPDYNLLISLLFTRYAPDLLKFPFDSKHSIAPETIACAQKINARFPRLLVSNKDNWGGYFVYNRVIYKPRKSSLKVKIIQTFPALCPQFV
jgi:hypothetical protein